MQLGILHAFSISQSARPPWVLRKALPPVLITQPSSVKVP